MDCIVGSVAFILRVNELYKDSRLFKTLPLRSLLCSSMLALSLLHSQALTALEAAPAVTRSVCSDEAALLEDVQNRAESLEAAIANINAALAGDGNQKFAIAEVISALDSNPSEADDEIDNWPDQLTCGDLRDEYAVARESIAASSAKFEVLREDFWNKLPPSARGGLRDLFKSFQRLQARLTAIGSTENASLSREQLEVILLPQLSSLVTLRSAYTTLLPTLDDSVSATEVNTWLNRWRESMALIGTLSSPSEAALKTLTPAQQDQVYDAYRGMQRDASRIAITFNRIRGYLWQNHHDQFLATMPDFGDRAELLIDEALALGNGFRWLYLDALAGSLASDQGDSAVLWRLLQGAEYLLGLGSLVLLAFIARYTRSFGENLQARFAESSRGKRSRVQLVRLFGGIPHWLPWLTAWYGLDFLQSRFVSYELVLVLPLLPFAKLLVLYRLLRLCGVWFLQRMIELAGAYLSEEQEAEIQAAAQRSAAIVMLPWLLKGLYDLGIGPSLTLKILTFVTIITLLVAFGVLLKPWAKEFIKALQYFLPERLDPVCDKIFDGRRFLIIAPLSAPILVVMTVLSFLHKIFVQFDWYRRLMARSFLLRSANQDDSAPRESDAAAYEDYQRWFNGTEALELPFIRGSVAEQMEQMIRAWYQDRSDENTLLLYGDRGTGKTSILQRISGQLSEENLDLTIIDVPAKTTCASQVAALLEPTLGVSLQDGPAELIRSDDDRRATVVMLDNAQNLFLRSVGGLEGWETLLTLTRARLRNIYWVISIDSQSWAYLANVFGRHYQFNTLLQCRPWNQNDIRSLILSRNQLSGFKITYDQVLLSTRGPEAGSLRNAEQLYFSLLWDACRGCPGLALELWLSSLVVRPSGVIVGLPEETNGASLERLEVDRFFVYAALIMHENMSTTELVESTAIPESRVRSALRTGFEVGFIRRSADRRYRIESLWYHPITRLLARKNLLHE